MFSFSGILIAFISLVGLIVLHELGHFVLAKKFKVKVERIWSWLSSKNLGNKI